MGDRVMVFGDDRSAFADRAWLWINNQRWPGWTVEAVTAVKVPRDTVSDELPVRFDEWAPASPRTAFAESRIGLVRHLRSTADPRLVLGSCEHASLVVVGPRGVHALRQLLLGSTADHLLRHSPAPLVIATAPDPAARVLVCTDGSSAAQHAVEVFAGLPLAADADHIAVLGVVPAGMYDFREQISEAVDRAIAPLSHLDPKELRAESDGNVAACILDHVSSVGADLVVLGTRGLSNLRRVVLGSTTNAVARAAPCSVLVVPPGWQRVG